MLSPPSPPSASTPRQRMTLPSALLILLLSLPALSAASSLHSSYPSPLIEGASSTLETTTELAKRADFSGFTPPFQNGGSQLTIVPDTYPAGLGEPLNVILSSASDPRVLVDSPDNGGFRNYVLGLNFSNSCLNSVVVGGHKANLGDGRGAVNQTSELRYNFGDIYFGTCRETFNGGNHFRYWTQKASKAIFMAVSIEMDLARQHDIVPNGYDLGRDDLVGFAVFGNTSTKINTPGVTENTTFVGSSSSANYTYETSVRYVTGLMEMDNDLINHYITVGGNPSLNGGNATDRLVAVLTVKITAAPPSARSSAAALVTFLPLTLLSSLAATIFLSLDPSL